MTKKAATVQKVNQLQRRFLQDRLRDAQRGKEVADTRTQPPAVVAARKAYQAAEKIINRWDHNKWEREKRGRELVRAAADKAREKILFGTPDEALAAVTQFEQKQFSLP